MQKIAQILIDQAHRQAWSVDFDLASKMNPANPKDASYSKMVEVAKEAGFEVGANTKGPITKDVIKKGLHSFFGGNEAQVEGAFQAILDAAPVQEKAGVSVSGLKALEP